MSSRRLSVPVVAGVVLLMAVGQGAAHVVRRQAVKSLVIAVPAFPSGNVWAEPGGAADQSLGDLFAESLTRPGPNLTSPPEPALATSWSSTKNAKVWTFKLRGGVRWQDGKPFTADDVKFSLDAITSGKFRASAASYVNGLTKVTVVNPRTVRLTFTAPQAALPYSLSYNLYILPKHLLQNQDLGNPTNFMRHPVGTGPFRIVSIKQGDSWVLARNPTWWGGKAKLDRIILKQSLDTNARLAALLTGAIDLALIPPQQAVSISSGAKVRADWVDEPKVYDIAFNTTQAPYDDARLRRALNYALDKKAILKAVWTNHGTLANGPLPTMFTNGRALDVPYYPYNPAKAKALLQQAGWSFQGGAWTKGGQTLNIEMAATDGIVGSTQIGQIVQQEWSDIGVKVTIKQVTGIELYFGMFQRHFFVSAEYTPYLPSANLQTWYGCGGGQSRTFTCDDAVDTAIARFNGTLDPKLRLERAAVLQQVLQSLSPAIYLFYNQEARGISKRIVNFPKIQFLQALQRMYEVDVR